MFKRNKLGKKSTFEDAIQHYLDGDIRDSALGFAAWAKANGLAPRQDGVPAEWYIPYEEACLCHIRFEPKYRFIFWYCDYSGEHDEGFMKAVQDHVVLCSTCHPEPCSGGDATIFGKEFKNVCKELTVQFENPDGAAFEHVKQLLTYWKTAWHTSQSYHCRRQYRN